MAAGEYDSRGVRQQGKVAAKHGIRGARQREARQQGSVTVGEHASYKSKVEG